MNSSFSNEFFKNTVKFALIFISVIFLLCLGAFIGAEKEHIVLFPEEYNRFLQSAAFGNESSSQQQLHTFEIILFGSFLIAILLSWTLYVTQKSLRNSWSIDKTNEILQLEIQKRTETKNQLNKANTQLAQSNSQLENIIESTTDAVSAIDTNYNLISFNKAYQTDTKKLFKSDIKLGDNILEALSDYPKEQKKSKELWDRALAGEKFTANEEYSDDSQQTYYYEVVYNPLKNENDEIIGASHILRNITKRKLAEQALKSERDFVSAIVEASNLLIMVLDLEGRIIKFNKACEELSGYKFEEVKGRLFWNMLVPADEAAAIKLSHRKSPSSSFVNNYVNHWITKEETLRLISWKNTIIEDGNGTEHIIATGIDITEKSESQEAKDRILDILETSSDFIGIANMRGEIQYLNPAGQKTLQVKHQSDLHSLRMISCFPKWARKLIQSEGIPTAIKRGSWIGETALKTPEGREIPVSQLILAHHNSRGNVEYLSTVARDISRQKRMEKELEKNRDSALKMAKSKSEFLANMSHEIRTPMNGIIGLSELILSTNLDNKQRDFASSIQKSGELLLTIVNDILDVSKIEAGKLELEKTNFDLHETVESIIDLFAEPALRKGLELGVLINQDVPKHIEGDPRRLRQILTNLVSNAIKFTDKGEIIIRVKLNKGDFGEKFIHFTVSDTGIGISKEAQEQIFEAFTQADNSITGVYGGTGLGLAISKQLTEIMGGEIGIESVENEGATFWFTISYDTEKTIQPNNNYSTNALKNKRVLIVDDNKKYRNILLQQVKLAGMLADEADSGKRALEMLQIAAKTGENFELAIIDLSMPGINGLELIQQIKETPSLRKLKTLLMPSINDYEAIQLAREFGVDSYVFKPVLQTRLYEKMSSVLTQNAKVSVEPEIIEANLLPVENAQENHQVRILIAEDNPVNQKVITHQIEKLGYEADITENGKQALEAFRKKDYSLILMDCQMPIMDGLQTTQKIREIESSTDKRIPIVAVTAYAIDGDRERCLSAGMDDYISKPTKQKEIAKTIAYWLNKSNEKNNDSSENLLDETSTESEKISERLLELEETCGADITLECIELFIEDLDESIEKLSKSIKDSSYDKIDKEAHKLKGSSANMGATRMPRICQHLMELARTKEFQSIESIFEDILVEYESLKPIYKEQKRLYSAKLKNLKAVT